MWRAVVCTLAALALGTTAPNPASAQPASDADGPDFDFPFPDPIAIPAPSRPPHPFGNSSPTQEQRAQLVPLSGAGEIDFPIDIEKLGFGDWRPSNKVTIWAKLWFNGEGDPVDCSGRMNASGWSGQSRSEGLDRKAVIAAFCEQFLTSARFKLAHWYGAKVERGYVDAEIAIRIRHKVKEPLRFLARDKGTGFDIRVKWAVREDDPSKQELRCDSDGILTRGVQHDICEQFMRSPELLSRIGLDKPDARRSRNLTLYLDREEAPLSGKSTVSFSRRSSARVFPYYVNTIQGDLPRLSKEDVLIELPFSRLDNPLWHGRSRWEGTVAVGFVVDRNGKVIKCAPLKGSGSALVDNATCAAAVNWARITFRRNAPEGPAYISTNVTWRRAQ